MNVRRTSTLLVACGTTLILAGLALFMAADSGVSLAGEAHDIAPFSDVACLDCHTDQARLESLAVNEEVAEESLSSGPG